MESLLISIENHPWAFVGLCIFIIIIIESISGLIGDIIKLIKNKN